MKITCSLDASRRSTTCSGSSAHGRFLSVIGTSGCGKSSLVRSGLIPSLHSGLMVNAGSSWRVAIVRPGEDPIGHLAAALDQPRRPGLAGGRRARRHQPGDARSDAAARHAGARRSDRPGAPARPRTTSSSLVDQFEELFRFRRAARCRVVTRRGRGVRQAPARSGGATRISRSTSSSRCARISSASAWTIRGCRRR